MTIYYTVIRTASEPFEHAVTFETARQYTISLGRTYD
jgi:hypothetical protein